MKIRNAVLNDIPSILKILNDAIINTTAVYDYKIKTGAEQIQWLQNKLKKHMPVIVAEYENKVIGYGSFDYFRPRIAYKNTVEHSVYVDKEFRQKGTGKLLLKALIEIAREKGFHTMIAGIYSSNEGSVIFHEKLDFTVVGRF